MMTTPRQHAPTLFALGSLSLKRKLHSSHTTSWSYIICGAILLLILCDVFLTCSDDDVIAGENLSSPSLRKSLPPSATFDSLPCGSTWSNFHQSHLGSNARGSVFIWTIAGGAEYRQASPQLLHQWRSLGLHPVLVVALDSKTASSVCQAGFSAIHWNDPKMSYSRVADAKFSIATRLAQAGYRGLFIELDVFCRKNPLPLLVQQQERHQADLVEIGHGDISNLPNIGVWLTGTRKVVPFFKGLQKVLSYSLHNTNYTGWYGRDKYWFDQEVLHKCQVVSIDDTELLSTMRIAFYETSDMERRHNLIQYCNQTRLNVHILDHSYISAHLPPTVYDTTYCVHPLMKKPFVPLLYKIAVAKFLGFDPEPPLKNQKLLKLASGDLTYNDCWERSWYHSEILPHIQFRVRYHIAALVELAHATDRVLVLPRYLRDKDAWGVPMLSVVDMASIAVPWTMQSLHEAHALEDDTTIIPIPQGFGYDRTIQLLEERPEARILALETFCFIDEGRRNPPFLERMEQLRYCFGPHLRFTPAVGGWDEICMS
jgi:hypothetical protein